MEPQKIESIIKKQREFFLTGYTLSVKNRIDALKILYKEIKAKEQDILNALQQDLGKSNFEAFMCEVGLALSEITYMIKNTRKFAKNKKVKTSLSQFAAKSYMKPCPYGNVLIMSPWNYPFLLTIDPLVDAIAAGNTAIVKPSAYSPKTSEIISEIITNCFNEEYVAVVTGGRKENASLLENKFDMIFFTGSQTVGREVLKNAADHITPVILELGGKSPCIVDNTANIKLAAKRIVFGKFLNCGQTCVAPDYILCHKDIKEQFVQEVIKQIKVQYGQEPLKNPNYGKIINQKHFERVCGLINKDKVVFGGASNEGTLQIEPTVLDNVCFDDGVMGEEIFGPILPIVTFENLQEIHAYLSNKEKPLALYIFSENKDNIKYVTERFRYGGGCINDCVVHLASSELGFGGVGESGMGSYHGKVGFDAFSHYKSIMDKKTWIDLPMRYQPYKKVYEKFVRKFLK